MSASALQVQRWDRRNEKPVAANGWSEENVKPSFLTVVFTPSNLTFSAAGVGNANTPMSA